MSLMPNANCGFELVSSSEAAGIKDGGLPRVQRVGCPYMRVC